jgi:sorting nexin-13
VFINFVLILSAAIATRVYYECNPPVPAPPEKYKRTRSRHLRFAPDTAEPSSSSFPHLPPPPQQADPKTSHIWRENVRSTVVEHAWETLCGSIVQEFIYETWYNSLSPDKEFGAEIRRILNHAFGKLAARARTLDLRLIMEDASELLMEQLELYRDTRELVISDAQQNASIAAALRQGDLATRERLLRERMEADGNLHPALLHPEGDYKMLTAVSGGLVGILLDQADSSRVALRAVARELLSGCVLRPLMMWCTPYHVNKGLYRLFEEQATRRPAPPPMSLLSQKERGVVLPDLDMARTKAMQGHWEFNQRIV